MIDVQSYGCAMDNAKLTRKIVYMRYRIEQIKTGEDEVVIRCRHLTPELNQLIEYMENSSGKLLGFTDDGDRQVIPYHEILYIESVDARTYAYKEKTVLKLEHSLTQLLLIMDDIRFFRCSKSMIINIDKVKLLKSLSSNRIDVTMCNGEHIMISRTYASDFRKRLRGDKS